MLRLVIGVFVALHGLVHLLYVGQSSELFELQPDMRWPSDSWALSGLLGHRRVSSLASISYTLIAAGFIVGGIALLARQTWWLPLTVASAAVSTVMILLFWNGRVKKLADQGAIAILINSVILLALLVLR